MKPAICFFAAMFPLAAGAQAQTTTINFDSDKVDATPKKFTTALTGQGKAGVWVVMKDDASPNEGNIIEFGHDRPLARTSEAGEARLCR